MYSWLSQLFFYLYYVIKTPILLRIDLGGVKMNEIEDLLKDVDILREQLNSLINKKQGDLQDPEVIAASKILNAALNQYNKLIGEKLNK